MAFARPQGGDSAKRLKEDPRKKRDGGLPSASFPDAVQDRFTNLTDGDGRRNLVGAPQQIKSERERKEVYFDGQAVVRHGPGEVVLAGHAGWKVEAIDNYDGEGTTLRYLGRKDAN